MNVRLATKKCFKRLLDFELSKDIETLINEGIDKYEIYPIDKLSRWLGYCQAYCIFTNQTTVNKERDFSRPLFKEAYKNENIQNFSFNVSKN